ncbi:hypothetical protein HPB49_020749 [Dermacentor silvarum]|uniref:Uncharacterized protein n=1 Tax=Dermacentor silvarum TaxID=543639 RepID=A0ACB8CHF3_DERSI|nr:hypothetical protein HPB49_020749 [Dermacentor silvarum]
MAAVLEYVLHSVHQNQPLSDTDHVHYLVSLLDGAAGQAVAGIQVTKSSYSDALRILKQRNGNRKLIEEKLLDNLRMRGLVTPSNNVIATRKVCDDIQLNQTGLANLKVSASSYTSVLCEILLKAIPQDMVVDYYKRERIESTTPSVGIRNSED